MRICIPMMELGEYGGVKVIFELADLLKDDGHEVDIITFNRKGTDKKLNFTTKANIKYIKLNPLTEKISNIPVLSDFIRCCYLLRSIPECDLAIANYFLTVYPVWLSHRPKYKFYYCQAFEPKFFLTYDDKRALSFKKILKNIRDLIYRYLAKKSYQFNLFMVANNKTIVEDIKNINKNKDLYIPILPPMIDTSVFKPKLSKNNEVLKIGAIASPNVWKGTEYFLRAVNILKKIGINNVEFVCAFGPPPNGSPFADVKWVNPRTQKELAEFYESLDILVSPILLCNEFPLPPLEAMACATAVISTPIIYGKHKIHYYEIPPKDAEAIANAVIELIQNPELRERIAENGYKLSKDFSCDVARSKLRIILNECVDFFSTVQNGADD